MPQQSTPNFVRTFVGLALFWLPFYRLCGFAFYHVFGWARPTWGHDIFMGLFVAVFLAAWKNRDREIWSEATRPDDSEGVKR
jgi:hypothetical protein